MTRALRVQLFMSEESVPNQHGYTGLREIEIHARKSKKDMQAGACTQASPNTVRDAAGNLGEEEHCDPLALDAYRQREMRNCHRHLL